MPVKEIKKGKKTFAIILPVKLEKEGTNFFTGKDSPFQLGVLLKKKGVRIAPHLHRKAKRIIYQTQEMLYLEKGKIRANFFDEKGKKIKSVILNPGDTVLLMSGGHGFDLLKDSKALLLKQGPYRSIKEDKSYYEK